MSYAILIIEKKERVLNKVHVKKMIICVTLTKENYKVSKLFLSDVSSVFVGSEFVNIRFNDGSSVSYKADSCKITLPFLDD